MLAARGVSLGLGKINLSDLNQLPGERQLAAAQRRKSKLETKKPKIRIKKKADKKTVWAACRAVIFGCIVIAVGLAMATLGYFDKHFSRYEVTVNGTAEEKIDKVIAYQLKSMQYIGPVLMGIGTFVMIIACVITLESRDKHAQIIQEESAEMRKKRLMSISEVDETRKELIESVGDMRMLRNESIDDEMTEHSNLPQSSSSVLAEIHRAPTHPCRPAPLAAVDSLLDINSQCSRSPREFPESPREFEAETST